MDAITQKCRNGFSGNGEKETCIKPLTIDAMKNRAGQVALKSRKLILAVILRRDTS